MDRICKSNRIEQRSAMALAVCVALGFGHNVHALPVGGVVSAGSTSISASPGSMTINQSSQNAAINWQGFSIGQGEAVRFVQPNGSAVALNRVLGADPSSIMGSLSANGKVFLVNPNGVLFGQGSQVNVGGLVASTLNITDSDFMAGRYKFSGNGSGRVVNQGSINADGGYIALLGANVSNEGTIVARLGTVTLASGNAMTLDVAGDGLLNVTVDEGALNAVVQNSGLIQADGGQVLLTAQAAGNLLHTVVNNTGVIQAQTIDTRSGTIKLLGDMQSGTMNVGGKLDASAPNGGDGGFIETSANVVNIADSARVTTSAPMGATGTWLIDPLDFFIQAGGNISGLALAGQLVTTNVTITNLAGVGNGDIFVNEAVSWTAVPGTSPTTLTLNGTRDVNINAAITAVDGSLVVCCGRDINVNAAISTTRGSIQLAAGRDVNLLAALTAVDGNITACAGRNLAVTGAITLTNGTVIAGRSLGLSRGLDLMAGMAATGPGAAGGTVTFGATPATVTAAPTRIFYNPTSYTTPTNYAPNITGTGGAPTTFMLVYPDGADKAFDGTTAAVFTSLRGLPAGVTLAGAGTANYDTAAAGIDKTITFSGFTLAGANAANFALPVACCGTAVGRTTGTITPLPVLAPVVPLVTTVPPVADDAAMLLPAFQMMLSDLEDHWLSRTNLVVTQRDVPPVQIFEPKPVPVVVPPVIQKPVVVPPPVLPPRKDRQ